MRRSYVSRMAGIVSRSQVVGGQVQRQYLSEKQNAVKSLADHLEQATLPQNVRIVRATRLASNTHQSLDKEERIHISQLRKIRKQSESFYRASPQKVPWPGSNDTISVAQFATLLSNARSSSQSSPLVLFSGDLFSPSLESTVTRGSHMVPIMNLLAPDVALTGNHDFDFGFPHLSKLVNDSAFPWILSNVIDRNTGKAPDPLQEFVVLEKDGMKIGIIGLVEKDWIETISSWPDTFEWLDMHKTAMSLSETLRSKSGQHKCDFVIALTHSRLPNDIQLARSLDARCASSVDSLCNRHGVDILFGGHDHMYYISKGCTSWENYNADEPVLGSEMDDGVLLVKSGTDFRDLSSCTIELNQEASHSVRRLTIKSVKGRHLMTSPSDPKSAEMSAILDEVLSGVTKTLKVPLCRIDGVLDLTSQKLRTEETAAANWFADVLHHSYDDALLIKKGDSKGADGVLLAAGTFRGDSCYGPGPLTLGDILEVLPFEDPMVVITIDGKGLWDALESALETWPSQEGRFPVVSGFRVEWDSRQPPGKRVVGIWREITDDGDDHEQRAEHVPVDNKSNGSMYTIVTREYMALGHDGFKSLVGRKYLVNHEAGQLFSTIVRRYLLGSKYLHVMKDKMDSAACSQPSTYQALSNHISLREVTDLALSEKRKHMMNHYRETFATANQEHMTSIDCLDGEAVRRGQPSLKSFHDEETLTLIHPAVDGRLKDIGRS